MYAILLSHITYVYLTVVLYTYVIYYLLYPDTNNLIVDHYWQHHTFIFMVPIELKHALKLVTIIYCF